MAFKFPFTNYHELNLTWVLDQLKALFEKSEENVTVIENYNGRLTAVETELPLVEETAQGASQQAASAAALAQQAKSTADTAQENAIQAQGLAGTARQEAQQAQAAADAATQAAQQAQATAQNFDGRITQAENDASQALEASRSFENRVQSAITTANNAAQTATNAQGIATRADQNAARALDTLNAQRSELERIGREQAALITKETESGKTEIENLAQSVLDSIPSDYTALSALVDKKAPVIINSASGDVASFDDGADNMKIQKLVVNIEPLQAGSGDPSPDNVRPISGHTGAEVTRTGKNLFEPLSDVNNYKAESGASFNGYDVTSFVAFLNTLPVGDYIVSFKFNVLETASAATSWGILLRTVNGYIDGRQTGQHNSGETLTFSRAFTITTANKGQFVNAYLYSGGGNKAKVYWYDFQLELGSTATAYEPYTGNQISVNWEDEAGTVYGGTIDLTSGKLVIDRRFVSFDGTENWTLYTSYPNHFQVNEPKVLSNTVDTSNSISNYYTSRYRINDHTAVQGVFSADGNRIRIKDSRFTTIEDFKAFLVAQYNANTPVEVVYKLATPIEYTLTANELSTLYGTNNIWANAGPVSVDYPADTKLYIDGKLAELQATILENI